MDAVPTITIVIADDHAVVRSGLRMLLDAEPGFDVVAEAGDVPSARRCVEEHAPTILVLDLHMPGDPSLSSMPALCAAAPDTGIVVLTMQNDPAFAREALASGARGYVLKEAADSVLVTAIRAVADGGTYLQPELGARLASGERSDSPELTPREVEVLRLIALGHTNAEIAESLFLSIRTVETHRSNIQGKLRLSRRADLVRYALERRLITS
ncbi:MAG: two-component system, NarL family, response regulator NreC [Thermoleophilaceae bacterium]|nr:two-component system, NarL family, response regulator NreC [Thermoleophilaceae bacterium]